MEIVKSGNLQFNIIFKPEPEGGFTVSVPSLPGCITYGENIKEAKKMAVDAIKGYLYSMKKNGENTVESDEENFMNTVSIELETTV